MAGVQIAGAAGGRRSLDSEINMIPMIDLLMVTISFLLITAVWSQMSRLNADAAVPGRQDVPVDPPPRPELQLHVTLQAPDKFVLAWRQGNTTVDSFDLPRTETAASALRFGELAARIEREWRSRGQHTNPTDGAFDRAVLHTDNTAPFRDVVAVMDAISAARRDVVLGGKPAKLPAFHVVFAAN